MDCGRIASNLLVGSCLLDRKEFEELRSLGVTVILSLQTEQDMEKGGIEWEEKEAFAAQLPAVGSGNSNRMIAYGAGGDVETVAVAF